MGGLFSLLKETFSEWSEDQVPRLAASLSYYALFSLAPLLVIAIAIAGFVLGDEAAQGRVFAELRGTMGDETASMFQTMVANAREPGTGFFASGLAVVMMLFGASGVINELKSALNSIWEVEEKPVEGIMGIIRQRVLSLVMVVGIGFLLMVTLVISTGLSAVMKMFGDTFPVPDVLAYVIDFAVSVLITAVLFAIMYKAVPDVRIGWGDVWRGGLITAVLFALGKIGIGLYLANSSTASSYGAGGAVVIVLLWIYYSAQVFFFGAEFTQVYANRYGTQVRPNENAVPTVVETPRKQGLPQTEGTNAAPAVQDGATDRGEPAAAGARNAQTGDDGRNRRAADDGRHRRPAAGPSPWVTAVDLQRSATTDSPARHQTDAAMAAGRDALAPLDEHAPDRERGSMRKMMGAGAAAVLGFALLRRLTGHDHGHHHGSPA